jgi:ribosomal protein L18E
MITALIALGVVAWLFVLVLCLGLARTATRSDLLMRREVAERLKRRRHGRRAA